MINDGQGGGGGVEMGRVCVKMNRGPRWWTTRKEGAAVSRQQSRRLGVSVQDKAARQRAESRQKPKGRRKQERRLRRLTPPVPGLGWCRYKVRIYTYIPRYLDNEVGRYVHMRVPVQCSTRCTRSTAGETLQSIR